MRKQNLCFDAESYDWKCGNTIFVVRILGNQNMNNEKVLELINLKYICCYACGAFLFQSLKRNQKARQINIGAQGWHPHPLISQSALLLQI